MLNFNALTKIQSIVLVAIIVFAAVGGVAVYVLLSGQEESSGTIKIGYITNLESVIAPYNLRCLEWAVEQINAEGGVLGRPLEVVAENTENDPEVTNTATTKLITVDKVDFIVGQMPADFALMCQDICAQHKKIYLDTGVQDLRLTQRVADDYEKYKYFFRCAPNETVVSQAIIDSLVTLREYSGFNKIALISDYYPGPQAGIASLESLLPDTYGFEIVYSNSFTAGTVDFTSYFAVMEAAGAEVVVQYTGALEGVGLLVEWYNRQSPTVVWGMNAYSAGKESWVRLEGRCEYTTTYGSSFVLGYPQTNKTLPVREAYIERWGEDPQVLGGAYDTIRFILYDALKRAGTTETDAVIKALEETSIETCVYQHFSFTSSHDYFRQAGTRSPVVFFQWQDGKLIPVYPKEMMEEARATYIYPDWSGPWD